MHPPLQLGAVSPLGGGLSFNRYILPVPGMEMEAEALDVCGYSPGRWEAMGAVSLRECARDFAMWLNGVQDLLKAHLQQSSRGPQILGAPEPPVRLSALAHNVSFDRGFLDWMARATGYYFDVLGYHWECSAGLMRSLMRAGILWPGSCKLDALRELSHCQVPKPKHHDAQLDAAACLHGYRWLLELARMGHVVEEH